MAQSMEKHSKPQAQDSARPLVNYLCKMKGGKCAEIEPVSWPGLILTAFGSLIGLGLVCLLSAHYKLPLLLPSFGATAVLLYGAWNVPMAQPRNVIGGHIISAFVGVIANQLFGSAWWAIAVGVTGAIIAMTITRTLHAPGGATAFVAIYNNQDYGFILSPVGLGVVFLVLTAVLINNLSNERKYPEYWL
ncbi:MAG: HPP family protein [Bacillota bacterium]